MGEVLMGDFLVSDGGMVGLHHKEGKRGRNGAGKQLLRKLKEI